MKDSRKEAERWYSQAENDLAYARHGQEVSIGGKLTEQLAILDQYYIPTRYPNGIPDGAPFEVYTRGQAEEALATAAEVLTLSRERISLDQ